MSLCTCMLKLLWKHGQLFSSLDFYNHVYSYEMCQ